MKSGMLETSNNESDPQKFYFQAILKIVTPLKDIAQSNEIICCKTKKPTLTGVIPEQREQAKKRDGV